MSQSTIKEILTRLVEADTALRGFTSSTLPLAAKARAANCIYSGAAPWKGITEEEFAALKKWVGGKEIFAAAIASFREGGCCYYIFSDGSLYFASSGESEVWADASDFAVERIINGYEGKLDPMDFDLLTHLGGRLAEAAQERGITLISSRFGS